MSLSKTVSEEITITGKSYNNLKKVTQISLLPACAGSGYQFHIADETIPYDLEHLRGVQEMGARYNILTAKPDNKLENKHNPGGPQIKVVEHLASALTASGLTDVHIHFDGKNKKSFFVPIVGPGIKGIVEAIRGKTIDILNPEGIKRSAIIDPLLFSGAHAKKFTHGKFEVTINSFEKTICYSLTEKDIERAITLTPHTPFSICVESSKQRDVLEMWETPFEIESLDMIDDIDLSARPMARVANLKNKIALSLLSRLGLCNGITKENYFFANPNDTTLQIVGKMFPKYKAGHHEHLAHSAVSDFPGEKHALCRSLGVEDLQVKITLTNMNHLSRVAALKQIYKDNIFVKI